jgi:hypothetical protein
MRPQIATATRIVDAPAEVIYNIIAEYRNGHPLILPKEYFLSLDVQEGGFGAGTIVNFTMRILGQTQSFDSIITEPEPGRLLVETDIKSQIPTSFHVLPIGNDHQSRGTIATELKGQNVVEGFVAKWMLQKIYRQELDLIAGQAGKQVAAVQSVSAGVTQKKFAD